MIRASKRNSKRACTRWIQCDRERETGCFQIRYGHSGPQISVGEVVAFDSVKHATKLDVAIGLVPKDVEDGSCWIYYAHEKITPLERSKIPTENFSKIKKLLINTGALNRSQENEQKRSGVSTS